MKFKQLPVLLLTSTSIVLVTTPTRSEEIAAIQPTTEIRRVSEIPRPITTAQVLLVQSPTPANPPPSGSEVVQVTSVKANPTNQGVEVILQTSRGQQLQIINRSAGNSFSADIPNAQLRLPSGEAFTFSAQKPIAGITEITVTNFDAQTIRVTVTGEAGAPKVELFDSPQEGLIFSIASTASSTPKEQQPQTPQQPAPVPQTPPTQPSTQGNEAIELVVTGELDGYRVPDASTATRTDTPLRDIPQSIQVVPQQVLKDQQITRLDDALRNVSGVTPATRFYSAISTFTIRGFAAEQQSGNFLRDGLPDPQAAAVVDLTNIQQIEVLKGPASVLYGYGSPGGTINLVTKQPLRDPFYAIEATIGSYDFYRGAIDLSGPLNNSKTALYRLNASYKNSNSFIDFVSSENLSFSPVVSLAIGDKTNLALEGEYFDVTTGWYFGLPVSGTVQPNPNGKISRTRNFGEPNSTIEQKIGRLGYRLKHQFSENWSLRNAFRTTFTNYDDNIVLPERLRSDNRTLERSYRRYNQDTEDYFLTTDIVGKFSTGPIKHQLLIGVDLARFDNKFAINSGTAAPIDLFAPVYNQPVLSPLRRTFEANNIRDTLGVYIQDQISVLDNLKFLLGVRFDTFEQRNRNFVANTRQNQSGDAFSPRLGVVYQPIEPISVYASYARSFTPAIGTAFDNSLFQPERATQYEVGVKADLNDRLSATFSLYNLTRSNVLTSDPIPGRANFSVQTGEQRSRGIELNIEGEILPGWNIIAGYAYTDAEVTQDNRFRVGNILNNVPEHAFNLWNSYEIQSGNLKGLGFGLGFFFVGKRQGDLNNSFQLPSYFRTDAAIFYKREQFRAAINIRNLFDVDYFETGFNNLRILAGEAFTVQGTISWQF